MSDKARHFLELHQQDHPLVMANAWDLGSAKLFEAIGFHALATTSSGHAATLGRLDGSVTRDEALAAAGAIAAATGLPVSADLENGFGDDPETVAETVRLAVEQGLAGCSIEDSTGRSSDPIYDLGLAVERIGAAAEAAAGRLVLTARSENFLHGRPDLDDTIGRLRAFADAGAAVLFAPGLGSAEAIRTVVESVDRPVNVLVIPGVPPLQELAEIGVKRLSVGGAFAFAAYEAAADAGRELLGEGTYGYLDLARRGMREAHQTFGS
jgi:2-methylisocitrate lyase-like PEP mutase family enzyme